MNKAKLIGTFSVLILMLLIFAFMYVESDKERRFLELGTKMDMQKSSLYGRVLDQHNQPVEGAVVIYELGGSALGGYNGTGRRKTDANGQFSILDRDASFINIRSVTHPNIEFGFPIPENTGSTWNDSKIQSKTFYGFQPRRGSNEVLWSDTSSEQPYVFKAWRIDDLEKQIVINLKAGKYSDRFEYNKVYTIDFLKPGQYKSKEGESDGQLRLVFHREADAEDTTQRWEAILTPISGGIQKTKDPYMNMASESGYDSEIHIIREKTGNENIDNLSNQQYYFTANNGQVYGSLFIAFRAKSKFGEMRLDINYKMNLDGEPSLVKGK